MITFHLKGDTSKLNGEIRLVNISWANCLSFMDEHAITKNGIIVDDNKFISLMVDLDMLNNPWVMNYLE